MYVYNAETISIVDGDTLWVMIDLGFDLYHKRKIRFADINAPELSTSDGKVSSEYLKGIIKPGQKVVIQSSKAEDKYGRFVATVYTDAQVSVTIQGRNINSDLVATGHAVFKKY